MSRPQREFRRKQLQHGILMDRYANIEWSRMQLREKRLAAAAEIDSNPFLRARRDQELARLSRQRTRQLMRAADKAKYDKKVADAQQAQLAEWLRTHGHEN